MEEFAKNYFKLLTEEYQGINLTRINVFEEFYLKQIIDSVAPQEQAEVFKNAIASTDVVIDIGFGGGFPLLPLAYKNPTKTFIGIETRAKKVKVVSEIAEKLNLNNVKFIHQRIENVLIDLPAVCTLKAVGKVEDFLNKINTNEKLQVYFYKGPNFYTLEKEQLINIRKKWNVIEETEITVENTDKRLIIGFENINVPCGTLKPSLVKLSELI
ncbi:MAG: hypothetical protein CME62_17160 [Halobacteriovoraceae bacterium]|nr:hypothetical protein [Halobacteriovoraceae bacterium]|tara:strand:+ start:1900 stop:2538 length:639 start_codon:yes stop_codon:yes gene_type:complete